MKFVSFAERVKEIGELTPKKVTQSSTINDNELKFGADNAVDGDLSTQSGTKNSNPEGWFKLEFDKSYPIHTVVYYYKFFTDWFDPKAGCALSISRFQNCVNSDTGIEVSVYKGQEKQTSCGIIELTSGLIQSDQIYRVQCDAEGDTVQLYKAGGIPVYEIAVISDG